MDARVAVLREFNRSIELSSVRVPDVGHRAAIVRVSYAGVCGTDVHLQSGHLPVPTPIVLGHEGVGTIISLGDGLDVDATGAELHVGDVVGWTPSIPCGRCRACLQDRQASLCASRLVYGVNQNADVAPFASGSWGEYIYLQPGTTIFKLPPGCTELDAIALGCAGPTATHGILGLLGGIAGQSVVVQGAGPVGLASAIIAKMSGARTVVIVGAPESRLAAAHDRQIADEVINIQSEPEAGRRADLVRSVVGASGADIVIEATGVPAAVAEGIDLSRRGGTYLVLGQYTDHGPTPINPHYITQKQLRIQGSWGFHSGDYLSYLALLPRLVQEFDPRTFVSTYPLADANAALDDMRHGRVIKAVLVPGSADAQ
jgi:threonine dehydrogenase-like Zn-dependent dehydrogenase